MTKGGRFLPGHDAKLKNALIASAIGGSKRASNKLETLGWTRFLDDKQARLAKKAEGKKQQEPHPKPRATRVPRQKSQVPEVPEAPEESSPDATLTH